MSGGHIAGLVLGAGAVALLVGVSLVNVQDDDGAEEFGSALERIESGGTVRIGAGEWTPYSQDVEGHPKGLLPELAEVVFTDLGANQVEFAYESVHSGEHAHNRLEQDTSRLGIDVLILPNDLQSACTNTRPGNPVTENLSALLVEGGNPHGIEDFADFSDGNLVPGAPLTRSELAQADVDRNQLVRASLDDAPEMIFRGEVDGYIDDSARLRQEVSRLAHTHELEVTDPIRKDQLSYSGFAFPSDEDDLREAVDEVVGEMRDDGRLAEIGEPRGFTNAELTPGASTAEELCDGG